MSYLPVNSQAEAIQAARTFGVFATRLNMARASPATHTTAAFDVPALNSTVLIAVASSAGFQDGDYLLIGTRAIYLTAPVHATSGPGALTFTARYPQGWPAGANIQPVGQSFVGPAGQYTTMTALPGALPAAPIAGTLSISVADRAQIPSGGVVKLTNYAGLYQVVGTPPAGAMTVRKVGEGDLATGRTCVVDTTYAPTIAGTAVTQIYPLVTVPAGFQFMPVDAWLKTVSVLAPSANTPAISIGYHPNPYSGRVDRLGDIVANAGQQAATVMPLDFCKNVAILTNTDSERQMVMEGLTLGARVVTASTSTTFVQDLCVRGTFSPFV